MNVDSEYTILIDGGAGRVVTSIPALEEFVKKNPNTNVVVDYWDQLIFNNPILHKKLFNMQHVRLFDKIKNTQIIKPEPYFNNNYINGKISLAQAFNEILNGNIECPIPRLYPTPLEIEAFKADANAHYKNDKPLVAFHPFGSESVVNANGHSVDPSYKSFLGKDANYILNQLVPKCNVVLMLHSKMYSAFSGWPLGTMTVDENMGLRYWMGAVASVDAILGVDSLVQHIARALDVPGVVVVGNSNITNVTYSDWFNVIQKNTDTRSYVPIRMCWQDYYLNTMANSDCMTFDKQELDEIVEKTFQEVEKSIQRKNNG